MNKNINLPTMLTIFRLIISIVLLPYLIVHYVPLDDSRVNLAIAGLFMLIALTDFLDGFIARRYNQVTLIGGLLDPVADKFLLLSVLVGLLAIGKIQYMWVLALLGREMYVMALRLVASERGVTVKVSSSAKFKTIFQMITLGLIILVPRHLMRLGWIVTWVGLGFSVYFSFASAFVYTLLVMRKLEKRNQI